MTMNLNPNSNAPESPTQFVVYSSPFNLEIIQSNTLPDPSTQRCHRKTQRWDVKHRQNLCSEFGNLRIELLMRRVLRLLSWVVVLR